MFTGSVLEDLMIQWFDDLTVGMRYKGGEAEVTRDDIKRFAAEFDPQPFHLDETAAEKSIFKGLAASGCILPRSQCDWQSTYIRSGRIRCWVSPSTICAGWLQFAPVTSFGSRVRWSNSHHLGQSRRAPRASDGRSTIRTANKF